MLCPYHTWRHSRSPEAVAMGEEVMGLDDEGESFGGAASEGFHRLRVGQMIEGRVQLEAVEAELARIVIEHLALLQPVRINRRLPALKLEPGRANPQVHFPSFRWASKTRAAGRSTNSPKRSSRESSAAMKRRRFS